MSSPFSNICWASKHEDCKYYLDDCLFAHSEIDILQTSPRSAILAGRGSTKVANIILMLPLRSQRCRHSSNVPALCYSCWAWKYDNCEFYLDNCLFAYSHFDILQTFSFSAILAGHGSSISCKYHLDGCLFGATTASSKCPLLC